MWYLGDRLVLPSYYKTAILGKKPLAEGIQCEAGRPDQPVLFWALSTGRIWGKDLQGREQRLRGPKGWRLSLCRRTEYTVSEKSQQCSGES